MTASPGSSEEVLLLDMSNLTEGGELPAGEATAYPPIKQPAYMIFVYSLAYLLIFLCALIGNTMVIIVVIRTPRMRNVTNYLIANLAVADILVAIFCIPITLLSNIFSGEWRCRRGCVVSCLVCPPPSPLPPHAPRREAGDL